MADMDKAKKIKLGFAVVALVVGGAGVAYSLGLFDSVLGAKVQPGTAEMGANAPLITTPELTPEEKVEQEAEETQLKETIKDTPAAGS